MAAGMETAFAVGLRSRWPACAPRSRQAGRASCRAASTAREGPRSPSRAPGRCIAAGRRVAHPLFLIPLPRRGRGSRRGGTHPEARGGASGPPHPSLSPQGERERRRRTARGVPKSFACARPLHRGRETRRASPFPDSSPPTGERIKERGGRTAQAESKAEGGRTQRLEVAPAAPLTLPSPPKGRGRQERAARAGMTAVGRPAPACHPRAWPLRGARLACRDVAPAFLFPVVVTSPFSLPLSSLLPVTLSEAKGLREAICPSAAWRTRLPAPTRQAGRCA